MSRVIALHARLTGPHYHSTALRFGTVWKANCYPKDFLEFSEYGRRTEYPGGSWLVISIMIGALMWMIMAAVFL